MPRWITTGFIILVVIFTGAYVYERYWPEWRQNFLPVSGQYTIYIENSPITVTVADDDDSRRQGLSGVESLGDQEGKLFIFDEPGQWGIWMRGMRFAIDIIWIDGDMRIVHIEENIDPSTFPQVFSPAKPARFVLEVNAYFVDAMKIEVGQMVHVPLELLPADLRPDLI